MIVEMKKVSVVVLDSQRKASLKKLRKLGLVHLETVEGKGPVLAAYKEANSLADKAISIIDEIKVAKKNVPAQEKLTPNQADEKARYIVSLNDRKKSLLDLIGQSIIELERLEKWGSVDPNDFATLAQQGIFMYMYEIPVDKYSLIGEKSRTMVVNSEGKIARFLLLSETEITERPDDLPPEAFSVPMPDKSTDQLVLDIQNAESEIATIEKTLLECKKYRDGMVELKSILASDIEFETFFSGMNREETGAEESKVDLDTVESALEKEKAEEEDRSGKLAWVTGYVPVDSVEDFLAACKMNEWACSVSDPGDEDPVPTKLKNNKLVSIIYPLTDFLDVTPGYKEFDISGWFLLFFCIFFGMIFADAGYGALIAVIGLILLSKSKKGKKSLPVLVTILGLSTMVYGLCTCSWFGIEWQKLPGWMVDYSLTPISASKMEKMGIANATDIANTNQKVFCFMLALIQLSIAHIKCFIANRKSLKCIGDFGSLMQLWGMFYVVMNMVVDGTRFPLLPNGNPIVAFGITFPSSLPMIAIIVLAVGFVLSFIFSNYEGSIGKSILESCKNIISVFLGIVNVFSDIVSYIRLWAVALAGAAISSTVNGMAGPMFGKMAMVIFAVVLLVFGHGLNMILNLLSVIVHGVRLNTLEFSQHLGMSWSGTKYHPFSESGETAEVDVESLGKTAANA